MSDQVNSLTETKKKRRFKNYCGRIQCFGTCTGPQLMLEALCRLLWTSWETWKKSEWDKTRLRSIEEEMIMESLRWSGARKRGKEKEEKKKKKNRITSNITGSVQREHWNITVINRDSKKNGWGSKSYKYKYKHLFYSTTHILHIIRPRRHVSSQLYCIVLYCITRCTQKRDRSRLFQVK